MRAQTISTYEIVSSQLVWDSKNMSKNRPSAWFFLGNNIDFVLFILLYGKRNVLYIPQLTGCPGKFDVSNIHIDCGSRMGHGPL